MVKFGDSQIFKQSDVILVSNYYNEKEGIERLDIFINKFKKKENNSEQQIQIFILNKSFWFKIKFV